MQINGLLRIFFLNKDNNKNTFVEELKLIFEKINLKISEQNEFSEISTKNNLNDFFLNGEISDKVTFFELLENNKENIFKKISGNNIQIIFQIIEKNTKTNNFKYYQINTIISNKTIYNIIEKEIELKKTLLNFKLMPSAINGLEIMQAFESIQIDIYNNNHYLCDILQEQNFKLLLNKTIIYLNKCKKILEKV